MAVIEDFSSSLAGNLFARAALAESDQSRAGPKPSETWQSKRPIHQAQRISIIAHSRGNQTMPAALFAGRLAADGALSKDEEGGAVKSWSGAPE